MVAVVWWHPTALAVLVILGAALTARELAQLLLRSPRQHLRALAPALAALVVALAAVPEGERVWLGALTAALLAAGLIAQLATTEQHRFANWALAAAAGGYAGALLGLAVVLRASPDGFAWTLLALVVTWAYDSLAFLTGRSIGRHGFMTHISPRKTWEGVAGGTPPASRPRRRSCPSCRSRDGRSSRWASRGPPPRRRATSWRRWSSGTPARRTAAI